MEVKIRLSRQDTDLLAEKYIKSHPQEALAVITREQQVVSRPAPQYRHHVERSRMPSNAPKSKRLARWKAGEDSYFAMHWIPTANKSITQRERLLNNRLLARRLGRSFKALSDRYHVLKGRDAI